MTVTPGVNARRGSGLPRPRLIAEITFAETRLSAGEHRREATAIADNAVAKILNVSVLSKKFARIGVDRPARTAGFPDGHESHWA